MPSATQCVAVARVAALVSAIDSPDFATASQIAERAYGLHKLGQTLLTLYREDATLPKSERRSKRIVQLKERIRSAAGDLALDVEFLDRADWPMRLTVQIDWKQGQGSLGSRRGEDEVMELGGRG